MTFREFVAVEAPLAALFAVTAWLVPATREGLAFAVPGFVLATSLWYLYFRVRAGEGR